MTAPREERDELQEWTARASPPVTSLVELAAGIEAAFVHASRPLDHARTAERALVLLSELRHGPYAALADQCPDDEVAAELRAAVAVLRNAALLVGRLADASPGRETDLASSCAALLSQGTQHLDHVRGAGRTGSL